MIDLSFWSNSDLSRHPAIPVWKFGVEHNSECKEHSNLALLRIFDVHSVVFKRVFLYCKIIDIELAVCTIFEWFVVISNLFTVCEKLFWRGRRTDMRASFAATLADYVSSTLVTLIVRLRFALVSIIRRHETFYGQRNSLVFLLKINFRRPERLLLKLKTRVSGNNTYGFER